MRGSRPDRRPSPAARIGLLVFLLILPLLSLELGVRVLIATDRLPVAGAHAPEFEVTWQNLSRLGTADVLILGDSVSQQSIEPAVLSAQLEQELGRPVSVFNAASPGGRMGVSRVMVEELAREGRLPRVAIVGVFTGTLKEDETYRFFFSLTPMGGLFSDCERWLGYAAQLDCRFGNVSAAWRWRGHPDRILQALATTVPRHLFSGGLLLREDGFREGRGASLAKLQAQMDSADLRRRLFVFPADARQDYVRLIDVLRSHGVAIVPVAIPDTPPMTERLEQMQPGRHQLFRQALDVLEEDTGLAFVDPVAFGSWWGDGMARNFVHLSAAGAVKFTRQLWRMPEFRDGVLARLAD